MSPDCAVIVMAKKPEPGATKTRLIPYMSAPDAARFYECLLLDTLQLVSSIDWATPFIAVTPSDAGRYFATIAPETRTVDQGNGHLGDRLANVMTDVLAQGFGRVAVVGSDVPTLPVHHIRAAFEALVDPTIDMALDPSADGGYHLIAWKRPYPSLVQDVEMSTPRVLADTLALAEAGGVRVELLEGWYDVDVPEDLDELRQDLNRLPSVARHTRKFLEGLR